MREEERRKAERRGEEHVDEGERRGVDENEMRRKVCL